jgi:hypothetical protein
VKNFSSEQKVLTNQIWRRQLVNTIGVLWEEKLCYVIEGFLILSPSPTCRVQFRQNNYECKSASQASAKEQRYPEHNCHHLMYAVLIGILEPSPAPNLSQTS